MCVSYTFSLLISVVIVIDATENVQCTQPDVCFPHAAQRSAWRSREQYTVNIPIVTDVCVTEI